MTEEGRVYKYVADLDLENLAIVPKDGWLYSDGTHIGSCSVTEGGTFTVELIPEEVENESNVAGGAIIAASLDADADRTIPDGAQITVSAADFTNDIIYSNPGSVKLTKSATGSLTNENGRPTQTFTIQLTAKEIMSDVTITDTITEGVEVDMDSFEFSDSGLSVAPADGGFKITVPPSAGKLEQKIYTIKYKVHFAEGKDITNVTTIGNTATLNYTDEHGQPAGPNWSAVRNALTDGSTSRFLPYGSYSNSLYTSHSHTKTSEDRLMKAIQNNEKLFRIGTADDPNYVAAEGATLADFDFNEKTGLYTMEYLIFMPSPQTFNVAFDNTADADFLGTPLTAKNTTAVNIKPDSLLIKSVGGYAKEDQYKHSATDMNSRNLYVYDPKTETMVPYYQTSPRPSITL